MRKATGQKNIKDVEYLPFLIPRGETVILVWLVSSESVKETSTIHIKKITRLIFLRIPKVIIW